MIYRFGGQILHIYGENLLIGNEQNVFIGNYQCMKIQQTFTNILSCRSSSMRPDIYPIMIKIDNQRIHSEQQLLVTPNPVIEDIDPTNTFAR